MLQHGQDLVLAAHQVGSLGHVALQVDGVEHAAGGAQAAADAAVPVHDGDAAAQAAAGLGLDLLLGEGETVMLKGLELQRIVLDLLAGGLVIGVQGEGQIGLVKFVELAQAAMASMANFGPV